MYCRQCGKEVGDNDKFCQNCGSAIDGTVIAPQAPQQQQPIKVVIQQPTQQAQPRRNYVTPASDHSRTTALILCILVGYFGVHRFYVGKVGTGILWVLTFGLFGFGWIIDIILILCGSFTDNVGMPLRNWH